MRNVFVSYSHRLDQDAADDFRTTFGIERGVFSDRSLENMDIGHLTDDTIRDNYIRKKLLIRQLQSSLLVKKLVVGGGVIGKFTIVC